MTLIPGPWPGSPSRPKRRHQPPAEPHVFQLRIGLNESQPPIWRRIEIRSNVTLWTLHRVMQGAFDWYDGHLFQFSLGHPYAKDSELFLCDFDIQEGEQEGTSVDEVRLDETLQKAGDQLDYLYDYGDNWHLTIILEKLRPALPQDPTAECTAGERTAPPEDSGGITDAESLSEFFQDPAFFDLDATNETIRSWLQTPPGFAPAGANPHMTADDEEQRALYLRFPQFHRVLDYCFAEEPRLELIRRLKDLRSLEHETADMTPTATQLIESFSPTQLLLDEIGDGIKLTSAGYLPPKIALRLGEELGLSGIWLSSGGESKMIEVAEFRAMMQHVGLLRKHKGDLLPTQAGKAARKNPEALWNHLADRLLPRSLPERTFAHDASLITLLFAATSDGELNLETVGEFMTQAGWSVNHGPVKAHHVVFQGFRHIVLLWYCAPKEDREWFSSTMSPVASQLARTALLGMKPAAAV